MSKHGPIVIVDDDTDEHFLYTNVLETIGVTNEVKTFVNGKLALEYLINTPDNPFIIICDMQMPIMSGLELREHINNNPFLRKKSTPFIFRTGTASNKDIATAYDLTVQGFFTKPGTYGEFSSQLKRILDYWTECLEPNNLLPE